MKRHREKYKYIGVKCKRCGETQARVKGYCLKCYHVVNYNVKNREAELA